jgi:hypothetical protein
MKWRNRIIGGNGSNINENESGSVMAVGKASVAGGSVSSTAEQ